ncbi:oxidoreductase [Opitutaceae bacterium TAV5]|nr:oxidoreductase [Opitutaceae bacterium TAV5]
MNAAPLRTAIIGLGGFAGSHHEALLRLEENGAARLVATCDPRPDAFPDECQRWRFRERGIRVFADHRAMLDASLASPGGLDLVVIPTPIALHAPMHRDAVERGVAVYLEKPPTLDPGELEAMIACDRRAAKTTLVGFNFIIEPAHLALKSRLLAGEFGRLREVRLLGQRPRPSAYFRRNAWAGRLRSPDGRLLLDSCLANAMAHYVHNALFWAGPRAVLDWAPPAGVQASLWRAHDIEGADTVFARVSTPDGVTLRLALTHALHGIDTLCETLVTDEARIDWVARSHYAITWHDHRMPPERRPLPSFDLLAANHLDYHRYLRGETSRPSTRLEDCRPFVRLNALCYLSAGTIADFPAALRHPRHDDAGQEFFHIDGLDDAMRAFLETGAWPRLHTVSAAPRTATPADSGNLSGAIDALLTATPALP